MRNLQVSIESEWSLVIVHILVASGTVLITQIKYEGNHKTDAHTDAENNPIRRVRDAYRDHYRGGDDEARRTFYPNRHPGKHCFLDGIVCPRTAVV